MMRRITVEALLSGTFGSFAMMPPGFLFKAMEMRVGHYGPKFAALYLEDPSRGALFLQHLVIGWVSAVPLCLVALHHMPMRAVMGIGTAYGVAYYVLINSLGLPLYFGDPLPWSLGLTTIIPSLVVHIVFGVAVACCIYYHRVRGSAGARRTQGRVDSGNS